MKQYKKDLQHILDHGTKTDDRTGTGTISYFGMQSRYDMSKGFPLVTTKKLHIKSIVHELLWFLSGSTNIKYLQDNGVKIWNEWASPTGELGPVYGKQWRDFGGVDQIAQLIENIKSSPNSRRHIVSAWNPVDVPDMALPPCHTMWQVNINGGKMDLQLYQRSADMFLGVPFNIASYALLLHMIAHVTGYEAGSFIHTIGDAHIYNNHLQQVDELLKRKPLELPALRINRTVDIIFDFKYEDFSFDGYQSWPSIKAPVAV